MKGDKMECPICAKVMWDNRSKKLNPKAPDYRCKDPECKYSLNSDTGEYEPGEFTTGVWLKKEVEKHEEQIQQSVKPKVEPKPEPKKDEFVEGKKENARLMTRNTLMCEVIKVFGLMGAINPEEMIATFNKLWAEVER